MVLFMTRPSPRSRAREVLHEIERIRVNLAAHPPDKVQDGRIIVAKRTQDYVE